MGNFSSREAEQSCETCLSQHVFRSHIAQSAIRSQIFPIAMKTMKYVCYNSAGINEQNTAGVSHFAVTRLG